MGHIYGASFLLISEIIHNEIRLFSIDIGCGRGAGVISGYQIGSQRRPEFQRIAEVGADTQECSVHQRGTLLGSDCFMIPFSSVLPHGSRFRTLNEDYFLPSIPVAFCFHSRSFPLSINIDKMIKLIIKYARLVTKTNLFTP